MIIEHNGKTPQIHPSAFVAPTATVCGDVVIGGDSRILFGTSIIAEGGKIEIGHHCIVLENAVIRSTPRFSTSIGNHILIGPNAHVVGCTMGTAFSLPRVLPYFMGHTWGTVLKSESMASFI